MPVGILPLLPPSLAVLSVPLCSCRRLLTFRVWKRESGREFLLMMFLGESSCRSHSLTLALSFRVICASTIVSFSLFSLARNVTLSYSPHVLSLSHTRTQIVSLASLLLHEQCVCRSCIRLSQFLVVVCVGVAATVVAVAAAAAARDARQSADRRTVKQQRDRSSKTSREKFKCQIHYATSSSRFSSQASQVASHAGCHALLDCQAASHHRIPRHRSAGQPAAERQYQSGETSLATCTPCTRLLLHDSCLSLLILIHSLPRCLQAASIYQHSSDPL